MAGPAHSGQEPRGLYVTEGEVARRLGITVEKWRGARNILEAQGLPKRDPLFANKRFWPAVLDFLLQRYGVRNLPPVKQPDGEMNLDAL